MYSPGLNLQVAQKPDEIPIWCEEVSKELKSALSSIKLKERGVYVQASTLGSLEALLEFLKTSKIPVSNFFFFFKFKSHFSPAVQRKIHLNCGLTSPLLRDVQRQYMFRPGELNKLYPVLINAKRKSSIQLSYGRVLFFFSCLLPSRPLNLCRGVGLILELKHMLDFFNNTFFCLKKNRDQGDGEKGIEYSVRCNFSKFISANL